MEGVDTCCCVSGCTGQNCCRFCYGSCCGEAHETEKARKYRLQNDKSFEDYRLEAYIRHLISWHNDPLPCSYDEFERMIPVLGEILAEIVGTARDLKSTDLPKQQRKYFKYLRGKALEACDIWWYAPRNNTS